MKLVGMRDMYSVDHDSEFAFTVAIEGPDRVGKATQVRLLHERLTSSTGRSVKSIEMPMKDGYTHACIYAMLNDGTAFKYPSVFQSIQLANRVVCQVNLLPQLLSHDVMLFDRWNASMYAYGLAAGLTHDELIMMMQLIAVPDITIILDGDPWPKENLDVYERDMMFQRRVRDGYERWANFLAYEFKAPVYIVDANDDVDAVNNTLWDIVHTRLPVRYDNVVDMAQFREMKKQKQFMSVKQIADHEPEPEPC